MIPLFLWIYAKLIKPIVDRYWKPAVETAAPENAIETEKTNDFPVEEVKLPRSKNLV